MPTVSAAQKRLMEAAANSPSGYGGVSQKVGREFIGKDEVPEWLGAFLEWALQEAKEPAHQDNEEKPKAAGIMFVFTPEGSSVPKVLLLKRSLDEDNYAGYFGFPGGGIDGEETPEQAASREAKEEIGTEPEGKLIPVMSYNPAYALFRHDCDEEFTPTLNGEHTEFGWFPIDELPKPVHPGVKKALADLEESVAEDCVLAGDASTGWKFMAADKAMVGPFATEEIARRAHDLALGRMPKGLAFDKSSLRFYDADGRLHLESSHISKAMVCPYLGKEIPNSEALGLDPEKIYKLLRAPEELAKAAPTFNGIPILEDHIPVSADDHQPAKVVGATGTNAAFVAPYLDVALVIWAQEAIDGVDDESKRELSCGYRYTPDMTPGVFEGAPYDGVMRDLIGNHVALVTKGRAGPDVLVGDKALQPQKETTMTTLSRTAVRVRAGLTAYLMPMLAKDAKLDLTPVVAKLTHKTFADPKVKAKIWKGAIDAAMPMMTPEAKKAPPPAMGPPPGAQGHNPDDVAMRLLDMLEGQGKGEELLDTNAAPGATAPNAAAPAVVDPNEEKKKAVMDWARGKGMSEDDISELDNMMGASDEDDDQDDDAQAGDEGADVPPKKPVLDKKAMDAAINAAVAKAEKKAADMRAAEKAVRPYIGEITTAMDSAAAVYKLALDHFGVKTEGVHPSAFPAMLGMIDKPGTAPKAAVIAQDADTIKSYAEMFPGAAHIRAA